MLSADRAMGDTTRKCLLAFAEASLSAYELASSWSSKIKYSKLSGCYFSADCGTAKSGLSSFLIIFKSYLSFSGVESGLSLWDPYELISITVPSSSMSTRLFFLFKLLFIESLIIRSVAREDDCL